MKNILLCTCLVFLFSCKQTTTTNKEQLESKLDQLQQQIDSLKAATIVHTDTSYDKQNFEKSSAETKPEIPLTEKEKTHTDPPIQPKPEKKVSDTIYHKYTNGKLSVKITPWINNRRKNLFYNYTGSLTYEQEDVRLSYQSSTQLFFRSDGSVEKAEIHNNPGAANFWYESTITFSNTNQPQWKTRRKMPAESLEDSHHTFYWNEKTKQWVLQLSATEQEVPK